MAEANFAIELDEKKELASWELEPEKDATYFLDRHIFDKTKAQRLKELQEQQQQNQPDWYSSSTYEDWNWKLMENWELKIENSLDVDN